VKVVIDSSTILSVLFAEPESDEILKAITNNECFISAGNYLETAIVVDSSKDPIAIRKFDALIK
jgi:ribonuclease VapC